MVMRLRLSLMHWVSLLYPNNKFDIDSPRLACSSTLSSLAKRGLKKEFINYPTLFIREAEREGGRRSRPGK